MTKPKSKIVVFHCPEPLHTALMDLARREGEPASTLLRRVTRELVAAGRPAPALGIAA